MTKRLGKCVECGEEAILVFDLCGFCSAVESNAAGDEIEDGFDEFFGDDDELDYCDAHENPIPCYTCMREEQDDIDSDPELNWFEVEPEDMAHFTNAPGYLDEQE